MRQDGSHDCVRPHRLGRKPRVFLLLPVCLLVPRECRDGRRGLGGVLYVLWFLPVVLEHLGDFHQGIFYLLGFRGVSCAGDDPRVLPGPAVQAGGSCSAPHALEAGDPESLQPERVRGDPQIPHGAEDACAILLVCVRLLLDDVHHVLLRRGCSGRPHRQSRGHCLRRLGVPPHLQQHLPLRPPPWPAYRQDRVCFAWAYRDHRLPARPDDVAAPG
mmetsp:Transcript_37066/g.97106  ORF Transcript_37066/g.97106 Transcript_37066/m.97106 type:complete len:216 (-) Transcript_37066:496-1143(-)